MSLNLKVNIDKASGFCFGVVEAINKAEDALEKGIELYCLGDIVHNDEEIKRLSEKGMKTVDKKAFSDLANKTILFRAHGEPPESYKIAENNNNVLIDASCPIIQKLQSRIKDSYNKNEKILIYGKPDHPEVVALNGQINDSAIIIEDLNGIDLKNMPEKVTLYSQTTRSLDDFYKLVEHLEKNGKKVKVKDTICRKVSNRKKQLEKFCTDYEKIIFVSGKQSSNGKVLFEVCKKVNQNAYFAINTNDIDKNWFNENDNVGITGATSTPKWLMKKVKNFLEKL